MNARFCLISGQRGLSLVESLVGMALTLALIAGVGQVLLGTQFNTRSQNERAAMDDASRFAVEYLGRAGQRAGFIGNVGDERANVFLEVSGSFRKAAAAFGTGTTLSLRYQGQDDQKMAHCHNEAADVKGGVYTETWAVSGNQLRCTLTRPDGTVSAHALMDNVEAIDFKYGEDTDGDRYPNDYLTTVTDWANVTSVRVSLRMVSTGNNLTETAQPYYDFDNTPKTPTDRRLRRNVFTTVALRNLLP